MTTILEVQHKGKPAKWVRLGNHLWLMVGMVPVAKWRPPPKYHAATVTDSYGRVAEVKRPASRGDDGEEPMSPEIIPSATGRVRE